MSKEKNKSDSELVDLYRMRYIDSAIRCISSEVYLIKIAQMKWYQRLFLRRKIMRFLNSQWD